MTRDRAVSTTLGFVLTLGIASILVTGLLVATGGFVDDQRQGTVRDELEVLGQQLAADIAASDRMVRAGGTTVRLQRSLPDRVTGVSYRITVTYSGGVATVVLSTENPSVTVEVSVRTATTATTPTTLAGGDVVVVYTGSALEVRDG